MSLDNKVICGNNVEVLSTYGDDTFDLTVTSPPYDGLRTYNGFSFDFEGLSKELFRVTKEGGIVVWVVGDATVKGSETGTSFRQALGFMDVGFRLHDTMIYEKNGAAYPASAKSNRYSSIFEYMFILSKGKPKTHNLIKDKPNKWAGFENFGKATSRQVDGTLKEGKKFTINEFGYRNNIWRINCGFGYSTKDKIAYEHPAIFPEELARDHIITWSNPGDLVLDPFNGSGTTGVQAYEQERNFLGLDVSSEYCELYTKRMKERFSLEIDYALPVSSVSV